MVLVVLLSLTLVGCSEGSSNASDVIDILENDGYVLEERDGDSIDYYQSNMVNNKYDLNVDVVKLYVGYVNSSERWVEIIVLKDSGQAQEFVTELNIESTPGRLVIQQEAVVIITFSTDTANLFESKE